MSNDNLKYWERRASSYAKSMQRNQKCYDEICNEIIPVLKTDMLVLELACGTGQLTKKLSTYVMEWTATDFSPKMLREARRHCRNKYTYFDRVDATDIKYDTATFDVVVISNALHIMPNPDKVLKEICRVLVPGGLIIAPTFVYDRECNKLQSLMMNVTGPKVYHQWQSKELADFIEKFGFVVDTQHLIHGKPLDTCLVIGRKKTARDSVKKNSKSLAGFARSAVKAGGTGVVNLVKLAATQSMTRISNKMIEKDAEERENEAEK